MFFHAFIFDLFFGHILLMKKSLSSANLSLELHVVSRFWLESDISGTFCLYFAQPSLKLERPALTIHTLCCRTNICRWKLSAKVSLMLDNPFPIPAIPPVEACQRLFHPQEHENHLKIVNSFQKKPCFFKVIPGV